MKCIIFKLMSTLLLVHQIQIVAFINHKILKIPASTHPFHLQKNKHLIQQAIRKINRQEFKIKKKQAKLKLKSNHLKVKVIVKKSKNRDFLIIIKIIQNMKKTKNYQQVKKRDQCLNAIFMIRLMDKIYKLILNN